MPALEEGQIFERYFVNRWLGNGVSGESYEAKDLMLQQKVTLKLIHPWAILPDSARRQFFREMQGISRLNHPYLASVHDYGEMNSRLYMARRYITSGSLLGSEGRLWFHPPLRIPEAIRYGQQLAQALQHIHNQGYLHGALTFANILVLRGPNIEHEPDYAPFILADVGLANFVRRFGQPQIPFLPITAAPEQLGKLVTPASDQFALAVVLFAWLAGRPPYLGSPEEVEHLKLTETIAPLRSLNPEVTGEQEAILRRALAVYPEERYPSVLAFADALLATTAPQGAELPVPQTGHPQGVPLPYNASASPSILEEPAPPTIPESTSPAPDISTPLPEPTPTPEPQSESQMQLHADEEPSIPARLIITSPYSEEQREIILERSETTIGRAGSSDILLDHDSLTSRHHALLSREDDHYVIYDRQSVSGVFVNGQKLVGNAGQRLVDGDHVRIGNYELTFRSNEHKVTDETNHASSEEEIFHA